MAGIWVYAEIGSEGPATSALELLTKARSLGEEVAAVALGPGASAAAPALGQHGASTVYASEDPVYADVLGQPAAHTLAELVRRHAPSMIWFPSSHEARDVAGRLQVKTGSTLLGNASDVLGLDRAVSRIFGDTQVVEVSLEGPDPKLVLVRPKSFVAEPSGGAATVVPVDVEVAEELRTARRVERHEEAASGPKLEEARVVISGGRGLQDPSNLPLLDRLATAIGGAAVGATRAIVDAGWVPYSLQVGQTGKTVKPEVYLAIGISGATQHVVGMRGSRRIVAINKDPDAPIFALADLGVVGDALALVPKLVEEIERRKAAG
jgi:electron transfer flavoprotein alpha subunit